MAKQKETPRKKRHEQPEPLQPVALTPAHPEVASEDRKLNRSVAWAAWIAAVAAVIGAVIAVISLVSSALAPKDQLEITTIMRQGDAPTQIIESYSPFLGKRTGILSVYWKIVLSNIGDRDLSIIGYDVLQIKDPGPLTYSDMNQGLYELDNSKPTPLIIPFTIAQGQSRSVFVKLGILMDPDAYQLIVKHFDKNASSLGLRELSKYLWSQGIEFYGNKVNYQEVDGEAVAIFPPLDEMKEQVFQISFKTSRGVVVEQLLSWWEYGG